MCLTKRSGTERLGKRVEQKVPELERRADDDLGLVELPRDKAPAVPPVEQPFATALGDAVELSCQTTEVFERHPLTGADGGSGVAAAPTELIRHFFFAAKMPVPLAWVAMAV